VTKARSCRLISRRAARTSTAEFSYSDLPVWLAVPALVTAPSVTLHHQTRQANNLVEGLFPARLTASFKNSYKKINRRREPPEPNRGQLAAGLLGRVMLVLVPLLAAQFAGIGEVQARALAHCCQIMARKLAPIRQAEAPPGINAHAPLKPLLW
jgi:hypothetical protein